MARLNWPALLRQHNIPYTTGGPNVSRDCIGIRCPFCMDDPSDHLGIFHLTTGSWNCWRNAHPSIPHTAKRLVQALLRCSEAEAQRLVKDVKPALPADHDLGAELRLKLGVEQSGPVVPKAITMPSEFKPLTAPLARSFREYLMERGYRAGQLDWLITNYDLRYTLHGKFGYRIIIPVYDRYHRLLTWTGRTIIKGEQTRYLSLSKFSQVCSPKETLLGLPLLWECDNPRALLVCEGPFDAMRISTYGRSFGVYGTCLFGLSLSPSQMALLSELRQRFGYIGLLLDASASSQAFRLANSGLELGVIRLDPKWKDPAEMSAEAVIDLCVSLVGS